MTDGWAPTTWRPAVRHWREPMILCPRGDSIPTHTAPALLGTTGQDLLTGVEHDLVTGFPPDEVAVLGRSFPRRRARTSPLYRGNVRGRPRTAPGPTHGGTCLVVEEGGRHDQPDRGPGRSSAGADGAGRAAADQEGLPGLRSSARCARRRPDGVPDGARRRRRHRF